MRMANAVTLPRPGMAPIRMPRVMPAAMKARLTRVNAASKPASRLSAPVTELASGDVTMLQRIEANEIITPQNEATKI